VSWWFRSTEDGKLKVSDRKESQALATMEGITRTYRADGQEVPALRGVDLSLPRGVFAAIKGRSGSGKTTLLNILGGLDRPTSGSVYLDGQYLLGLNDDELTRLRRNKIGFVFQSFALLPTYSAFENVELMLRLVGLSRRERNERARRCLRVVGLEKWMDHRPDEMSGGQQQRVAIARSLATRPALILADEPTGELDVATGRQIFELFRHIVDKERFTVLVATHDPLIDEYADVIFYLQDGRLVDSLE
jgi:ABC-type lipoprotein export system ATPase subunit